MYVCLCNAISDKAIRNVVRRHQVHSFGELRKIIPVGNECGKCIRHAKAVISEENMSVAVNLVA
ncbi:MAG TPA: bacterioferritin-associated ferredoxin [Morganella sp. (in: Bacteria)]|nr:bacterioferritin-associated ferredoxin [Morganella sp. (in: enterobacteria)]